MENLAVIGLVMIVGIVLALQHLANWMFRMCMKDDFAFLGVGIVTELLSFILMMWAFEMAIELF